MQVIAQAYDNPIPGYDTPTTSNLRLWDALPIREFDLSAFNAGDYDRVCGGAACTHAWSYRVWGVWGQQGCTEVLQRQVRRERQPGCFSGALDVRGNCKRGVMH